MSIILQEGSSGRYVLFLEKALKQLGYSVSVDGSFGPLDKQAVTSFQASSGLTPDGVVGPLTEAALYVAIKGGGFSPGAPVHTDPPTTPAGPTTPAPSPVLTGGPIHGFDGYHLDDIRSFAQMQASGFLFTIMKSSQGLSPDSGFNKDFNGAKAQGMPAGAYHFMNYNVSGSSQAKLCFNVISSEGYEKTDMVPWCDWEYTDGHTPTSSEISIVRDFFDTMDSLTNRYTGVYYSNYLPGSINYPSWLMSRPQWVARYGGNVDSSIDYIFHQYSGTAAVGGVNNPADANIFRGSLDDLKSWISKT